jgi:hypothetical protein
MGVESTNLLVLEPGRIWTFDIGFAQSAKKKLFT